MKRSSLQILATLLLFLQGLVASATPFQFFADSLDGNQGTQIVVPIRANGFDSIISIQGTVSFDSAVLTYVGVQNMNLPSMSNANFGTSYVANGKLTFSWNEFNLNPITVSDSSELFGVVFQLVGQPGEESPIGIVGNPTLIEVVDWSYTPIPFTTRDGNVRINVPRVCELPDSLVAVNIQQTQADLHWVSQNTGANYLVEWGTWGFTPGNGIGTATGNSLQGDNFVTVTNLQAGHQYEFYVQETCDSLNQVDAGPHGFATTGILTSVTVYGDSIEGPNAATDTLYIHVNGFTDIVSAQGTFSWDPSVAVYSGVLPQLPNMNLSNFGTMQVGSGKLTFSWNDPTLIGVTVANGGTIFGLVFIYVGNPGDACPLDFVQSPTVWEFADATFNNAQLTLVNGHLLVTPAGTGISENAWGNDILVVPNPVGSTSSNFEIVANDGFPTILQASLLNELGQSLPMEWTLAGNSLRFQLPISVKSGIWFLKVDTDQGPLVKKIVVNKL